MSETGLDEYKPSNQTHAERRRGYKFAVGQQTDAKRRMPEFGSREYDQDTDSRSRRENMLIVGGALVTAGTVAAGGLGALEEVGGAIRDGANATVQTVEDTYNAIKTPVEGTLDLAGNLIPNDEPNKPRIPNYIMLGDVEVTLSDELNFRESPYTTGKAFSPNEIGWNDAKLANKVIVDGKYEYQPIEADENGKIVVHNPEFVVGTYTGGGSGASESDEQKLWMQLYRTDGSTGFIAFQGTTRGHVREIKEDPTQPSTFIKAETIQQQKGGATIVVYDGALPSQTSFITAGN